MRYSYATVALPTLEPERAVVEISQAGYKGIEWKVGEAPHAANSTANNFLLHNRCTLTPETVDAALIRARCDEAGLTVVGLAPYLNVDNIGALRAVLTLASDLGAPQIRFQAPRILGAETNYANAFRSTINYLEEAEKCGRDAAVRVVLEIHHNTIAPSASLARSLVERFDPAVIGVIYDVGNLVWEGYENHRMALDILGPYLHHVHLKNAAAERYDAEGHPAWRYTWAPLDDGLVDVGEVLAILADRGYSGWISLEDLSSQRSPLETLRHNARVLATMPQAQWSHP